MILFRVDGGRPAGWTETEIIELTQSSLAGTRLSLAINGKSQNFVWSNFFANIFQFVKKQ